MLGGVDYSFPLINSFNKPRLLSLIFHKRFISLKVVNAHDLCLPYEVSIVIQQYKVKVEVYHNYKNVWTRLFVQFYRNYPHIQKH